MPGRRWWRGLVLAGLAAVLAALVYQRGFGLQLGAPPSALHTSYHTEETWIVSEIARDLARMCTYAKQRQPVHAMDATVTLAAVAGAPWTYDVRVMTRGGQPVSTRLTFTTGVWMPEDYVPLVRQILGTMPTSAAAGQPGSSEHAPLLEALLDLRPETIERQNARISQRLASDMADVDAHEEAALLLGAFGLREAAAGFSDAREILSRMTAHLAMARARSTSPARSSYGRSGRYADVLRLILSNRGADALTRLDALTPSADEPDARTHAIWHRVLRMRVTQDWRDSLPVHRDTLLEQLEYFRARIATIPTQAVVQELDAAAIDIDGQADWRRITLQNLMSVQMGQRFVPGHLESEMREIDEVWRGTHQTSRPRALGEALNEQQTGCVTESGPRVVGWGTWARFFQRHLAYYVTRADQFYRTSLGTSARADALKMKLDRELGDLDLYPVASCWRRSGPRNDTYDLSRIADAIRVTIRAPELIAAVNWSHLEFGAGYEPVPVGMPEAKAWFMPASADRMAYDVGRRSSQANMPLSRDDSEAMLAVAPYDFMLARWYANLPPTASDAKDKQQADKLARMVRLMQPRIDYDVHARTAVEGIMPDGEAWRQHRTRTCELATEYCMGLAASLANAGREEEAAALYQRVVDDPTLDRVDVANNSFWLVSYYHRTGQARKALRVAASAERTGSAQGLLTRAWLMEHTRDYAAAAQLHEEQASRYGNAREAVAFYYRMARVRGDASYEDALQTWIPRIFPDGLQRFDPQTATAAPTKAVYVMSETDASRKAGVRPGDLIIGLDGWRTETLDQYLTVRAFREDGEIDLAIWRGGLIQRKALCPNRRMGIELRSFPFNGWSG